MEGRSSRGLIAATETRWTLSRRTHKDVTEIPQANAQRMQMNYQAWFSASRRTIPPRIASRVVRGRPTALCRLQLAWD
jgi:hypothetical protein